jgi:transposase
MMRKKRKHCSSCGEPGHQWQRCLKTGGDNGERETAMTSASPAIPRRRQGQSLSLDAKLIVLRATDKCLEEKDAGFVVSTNKPFDRAHEYTGVSTKQLRRIQKTWRTTGKMEVTKSRRGKYERHENWKRLWINVISDRVISLNLEGKPVTTNTIMEGSVLKNVMSETTLRRALYSMGFEYKNADKTQNFIESDYIKGCRRKYLIERMKIRNGNENIIEVWLDESYCHQHHVARQSWYRKGDVVKRKGGGGGRRWIFIYAGGGDKLHNDWRWFGEPEIFQGKNGDNDDYHKNMNSDVFGKYFEGLCTWMQEVYPGRKVVFHMDNAGYHKKIVGGGQRMSGAKKNDIIKWLKSKNVPDDVMRRSKDDDRLKTRAELYQLTKQDKYKGKSETETTAEQYGYRVLWIPPYHPMLNPIEEAWGVAKGDVARRNDGSNLHKVNAMIIDGFNKVTPAVWKKLVRRVYGTEDRMFKEFAGEEDDEDDDEDDEDDDEDDDNGGGGKDDENDDENDDGGSESSHNTVEENWQELHGAVDQQDDEDDEDDVEDDGEDDEEDDDGNEEDDEEDDGGGDSNEEGEENDGEDDDDEEDTDEDEEDSKDSDYNEEENEEDDDDDYDYDYDEVTYEDMFHDRISYIKRP